MSGYRNFYDETDHFFKDGKGRLFVALNYKGTNFGSSINTKENPDTILNEPIFQLMSKANYSSSTDGDKMVLAPEFEDFIMETATKHASFDPLLTRRSGYDTRADYTALDDVYNNWGSMSLEGREFYTTFLNLVTKEGKLPAVQPSGLSPKSTYLNLKKTNMMNKESDTIFKSTLPYLPRGMKNIDGTVLPVDYLHQVYDNGFKGIVTLTGGDIPTVYQESSKYWKTLDNGKFLRNLLYAEHKASTASASGPTPLDTYYDLSTEKLYKVNEKGELVNTKGETVVPNDTKLEEALKDNDSCSGTYTKKPCDLVYECLLSGDSKNLARCLSKYSISDIYNVARSELQKMNPQIIVKILGSFLVDNNDDGKIEEYLEWRGNLESRLMTKMSSDKAIATASAILNNKKLLEYIRNLMEIIRENPDIISVLGSKSKNLSDLPDKTKDLKSSTGLKYFIKPSGINRAQALSTQLTSIVQQLNVLPQNFISSISAPLGLANMNFGNPFIMAGAAGLLRGGSNNVRGGGCVDETIVALENLYGEILNELKKNGKDLVDEDKKHIESALSQLKKNHSQLVSALNDLKAFTRLNSALTAGINQVTLNEVKGASRISLDSQVRNLQSCINSTSTNQRNLIETLVSQVFNPMVNLAAGISTTGIRPL
jgi:hypothetical protein